MQSNLLLFDSRSAMAAAAVTAAVSGTITASVTEKDIRAGGKAIIITLDNGSWAVAAFNDQRQAIIDGLGAATSETLGWNNKVRDVIDVSTVTRTADAIVTITLPAIADYYLTASETITVTVPADAITGSADAVAATPAFTVGNVTGVTLTIQIDAETGHVLSVDSGRSD